MTQRTRPISWIKAAKKEFETFPDSVKTEALRALSIAADGRKAQSVKPLKGIESGIMEIVLNHRGDAYRVIYALQIANEIWVLHAFQKKSKSGIKTPKQEIELLQERLKRLKEALR
jgi:phage-related protein